MKYRAPTLRASAATSGLKDCLAVVMSFLTRPGVAYTEMTTISILRKVAHTSKQRLSHQQGTLLCLLRHILYHCIEVALGIRLDSRSDRYVGKVDAAVIAHAEEISFSVWFVVVVGMVLLVYDCGKGVGTRYLGRGT